MKKHWHDINSDPFFCHDTGKHPKQVFTDHSRPGVYNACEHCHEDKRPLAQVLHDLNESRGNGPGK